MSLTKDRKTSAPNTHTQSDLQSKLRQEIKEFENKMEFKNKTEEY